MTVELGKNFGKQFGFFLFTTIILVIILVVGNSIQFRDTFIAEMVTTISAIPLIFLFALLFSTILDLHIKKINSKIELLISSVAWIVIGFIAYYLIGILIFIFFFTFSTPNNQNGLFIANIVGSSAVTIVLMYRILSLLSTTKFMKILTRTLHLAAKSTNNLFPPNYIKISPRIKILEFMHQIIVGAIFISLLISFANLGFPALIAGAGNYIYSGGILNILLLSFFYILIEITFWLVFVQFD